MEDTEILSLFLFQTKDIDVYFEEQVAVTSTVIHKKKVVLFVVQKIYFGCSYPAPVAH